MIRAKHFSLISILVFCSGWTQCTVEKALQESVSPLIEIPADVHPCPPWNRTTCEPSVAWGGASWALDKRSSAVSLKAEDVTYISNNKDDLLKIRSALKNILLREKLLSPYDKEDGTQSSSCDFASTKRKLLLASSPLPAAVDDLVVVTVAPISYRASKEETLNAKFAADLAAKLVVQNVFEVSARAKLESTIDSATSSFLKTDLLYFHAQLHEAADLAGPELKSCWEFARTLQKKHPGDGSVISGINGVIVLSAVTASEQAVTTRVITSIAAKIALKEISLAQGATLEEASLSTEISSALAVAKRSSITVATSPIVLNGWLQFTQADPEVNQGIQNMLMLRMNAPIK